MFVKTIGDKGSKIMLVGESPGRTEDQQGIPFVGAAGKTLSYLLQQAGISRTDCIITNVARLRPLNNEIHRYYLDSKMTIPTPQMQEWINLLKEEIIDYNPNIIVALGATAQYHLTGEKGITSFRGFIQRCSLAPGFKVISTYHPQAVNMEWKLHFTTILDLRKALRLSESKEIKPEPRQLHATISFNEFIHYIQELSKFDITSPPIAVDIETCQPGSHIHIMGLADSPTRAYSFEILKNHKPLLTREDEFTLWKNLSTLFLNRRLLMHNGSYDAAVLMQNLGLYCKNFSLDTLVAAHVCWPECPRSLSYLSSICLDVPAWKHTSVLTPTLYNAADAANTWGIWEVLEKELKMKGLMEVFEFEMSQLEPAMMLQLQGLKVNEEVRVALKEKSDKRIKELEEELEQLVGKKVNYNSPKQLQQLLYIDLELPVQYKRRKSAEEDRKMSADAESVKKLWLKTHNPVLEKIMELKKLIKLVTGFLNIETSPDGTIHSCYNVTGATMSREAKGFTVDDENSYKSFGRWSSSKSIILPFGSGNLQNVPKKARKMFTAPEGKTILQADYMQAEAVVVSYLINDVKLKKMFQESFGKSREYRKEHDLDVHKLTGATMFKKCVKEVSDAERTIGKTIRHAPVHPDTEVLTDDGWIKIPQVTPNHLVMTFNPKDHSMQWEKDCSLVRKNYEESLLLFKGRRFEQAVSPDHKMGFYTSAGNWMETTAKNAAMFDRNRFPVTGICYAGNEYKLNTIRLAVAIQADGYYQNCNSSMCWTLKKERKIARLLSLFQEENIPYRVYKNNRDDSFIFKVNIDSVKECFTFLLNKHTFDLSSLLALGYAERKAFVVELFKWDGSESCNRYRYVAKERINTEIIATIAHITGYRSYISPHSHETWMVEINKNDLVGRRDPVEVVPYGKEVYCLTTTAGWFLVRYNGEISITGNTNYSAGPAVLSARLDISMKDAKLLLQTYHNSCPQLQMWQLKIQEELKRTRTLTNLFGRRHYFLERWSDSLFRSAYSFIPQSTVGDLLNTALVAIYRNHPELNIILQLHDAIYVMVNESEVQQAMETMRKAMLIPLTCKGEEFTIDVDFSVGKSWGDMTDI